MNTIIKLLLDFFPDNKHSPLEKYILDGQPQNTGDVDILTRQFHRSSTGSPVRY
jgi:hypothetical protein